MAGCTHKIFYEATRQKDIVMLKIIGFCFIFFSVWLFIAILYAFILGYLIGKNKK